MVHYCPYPNVSFCIIDRDAPLVARMRSLRLVVATKTGRSFVWRREGSFNGQGWQFGEGYEDHEPVLIDLFSASAMVQAVEGLRADLGGKARRFIEQRRGTFMKIHGVALGAAGR